MSFRIKQFEIMNHIYTVEYVDKTGKTESELGLCEPVVTNITVVDKLHDKKLPEREVIGNLWHEIVHALMYSSGYIELYQNEQFVDTVGKLIAQALMSAEYEKMPNMPKRKRRSPSPAKPKKRRPR